MKIYGLMANVPLAKTYTLGPAGQIEKTSYPMVTRFTSFDFGNDLTQAIADMSIRGGCLLKGELDRALNVESRARHTRADQKTQWICLDLDGITAWNNEVDDFLDAIGCAGVDYILQWSNSSGLFPGLRCHVFMLLTEEVLPERLKRWLKHLNLSLPGLRAQIQLNRIDVALRWPLDVTTCQNDKLIYVAPPMLGPGVPDPFVAGSRLEVRRRGAAALDLQLEVPSERSLGRQTQELVTELRAAKGLRRMQTTGDAHDTCIISPEEAIVTGVKHNPDFVYFNLNGGDSWGYYHPVSNPSWILNFKGEPKAQTSELLPNYWAQIVAARKAKENSSDKKT